MDIDKSKSWDLWEKKWKGYREPFERQWHLNLAFLVGKHYSVWNTGSARLEDQLRLDISPASETSGKMSRIVSNHILRLYRQKLSDFLKLKPLIEISSATVDENDISAAKTANDIAAYLQRKHEFQQLMRRWWMLKMTFGQASIYPLWNKDSGNAGGDEEIHLLTPFETFWPRSNWPAPPREVMIVQADNIDVVRQKYGIKDIEPESDVISSPVEQQIRTLLYQEAESVSEDDITRTLIHYSLPSPTRPKGLYRVEVKGRILHESVLPDHYMDDDGNAHLPVIRSNFYDIPMSDNAMSFIEPIISPQREYNFKVSRITDHFRKLAGKILIPFGAGLKEPINDESGQFVHYDPTMGLAPTHWPVPGLPASMFQDLARAKLDMEDLAASHDISHSKVPGGVKSGKAIQALQEGDESQMAPILIGAEEKMTEVFVLLLNIVQKNYEVSRSINVVGSKGAYSLNDFKGQSLVGRKNIIVTLGSNYPYSKSAREAVVMERLERGVIDVAEAREQLQLADVSELPNNVDLMAAKQVVENMLKGITPEVHTFDNHALHLKVIDETRKDPDFQETMKPDIKMLFDLVADVHMKALAKELEAQAAGPLAAQPQQGPPAPAGKQ